MRKTKGFTLVELLVVIAIIGLLSVLAVISLSGIQERARDTKRVNDISNIQKAMELVRSESGGYDSACAAGLVSACAGDLTTYLQTITNINDPQEKVVGCDATCSVTPCNYNITAIAPGTYTIKFWIKQTY